MYTPRVIGHYLSKGEGLGKHLQVGTNSMSSENATLEISLNESVNDQLKGAAAVSKERSGNTTFKRDVCVAKIEKPIKLQQHDKAAGADGIVKKVMKLRGAICVWYEMAFHVSNWRSTTESFEGMHVMFWICLKEERQPTQVSAEVFEHSEG